MDLRRVGGVAALGPAEVVASKPAGKGRRRLTGGRTSLCRSEGGTSHGMLDMNRQSMDTLGAFVGHESIGRNADARETDQMEALTDCMGGFVGRMESFSGCKERFTA